MGKRRDPKLYKITFADGDYEGLSVTLRGMSIRDYNGMRIAQDAEDENVVMKLTTRIAEHLVEWNREDENGIPLPATLESLMDESPDLINLITNEWAQAMTGVPAPLDDASPSGPSSAEADARLMEIPSESLSS